MPTLKLVFYPPTCMYVHIAKIVNYKYKRQLQITNGINIHIFLKNCWHSVVTNICVIQVFHHQFRFTVKRKSHNHISFASNYRNIEQPAIANRSSSILKKMNCFENRVQSHLQINISYSVCIERHINKRFSLDDFPTTCQFHRKSSKK